jgi:hypothetical protein
MFERMRQPRTRQAETFVKMNERHFQRLRQGLQ